MIAPSPNCSATSTASPTTALAAATGHWASTATGALATLAVITFLAIYTRISKPAKQR